MNLNFQGYLLITHTRLRIFIILKEEFISTFNMYQVRDTSLQKQDTSILHVITYSISLKKHIVSTKSTIGHAIHYYKTFNIIIIRII